MVEQKTSQLTGGAMPVCDSTRDTGILKTANLTGVSRRGLG